MPRQGNPMFFATAPLLDFIDFAGVRQVSKVCQYFFAFFWLYRSLYRRIFVFFLALQDMGGPKLPKLCDIIEI